MTHRYTRTTMSADVHLGETEAEIRWTDWTHDSANGPYVTVHVAGVCYYVHDLAQCAAIAHAWQEAAKAMQEAEQRGAAQRIVKAKRVKARHRITYDRSVDVSDPDERGECICGWQGDWWTVRNGQARVEGRRHLEYAEQDESLNH